MSIDCVPKGLSKKQYRATSGILERRCPRCEDWFPANTSHFQKKRNRLGVGGYCISCYREKHAQDEYSRRRKLGQIKGKTPGWTWTNKWVSVDPGALLRLKKRVRTACYTNNAAWLFDDVYAEALVRAHQGKWVNAFQCFWSVFDRELGHSGTAEREANKQLLEQLRSDLNKRRLDRQLED